jgi:hypothetical protein
MKKYIISVIAIICSCLYAVNEPVKFETEWKLINTPSIPALGPFKDFGKWNKGEQYTWTLTPFSSPGLDKEFFKNGPKAGQPTGNTAPINVTFTPPQVSETGTPMRMGRYTWSRDFKGAWISLSGAEGEQNQLVSGTVMVTGGRNNPDPENGVGDPGGGAIKPPVDDAPDLNDPDCTNPFTPEIADPFENPDERESVDLEEPSQVELIAENILTFKDKVGFDTFVTSEPPKKYLTMSGKTELGGDHNAESPVGGTFVDKKDRATGQRIRTAQTDNPSYYGYNIEGAEKTEISIISMHEVDDYDDCPNHEPDEPGIMKVELTLSEEYTTQMMKEDVVSHSHAFKGEGYYRQETPNAEWQSHNDETLFAYAKTKYKIRVPEDVPRPYQATWVEEFTPKDEDPDDDVYPEKEYEFKSAQITGDESQTYTIDPADSSEEGTWQVRLLPVEVNHVNRGLRFFGWGQREPVHRAQKIYSGVFDGDMIEWRIQGLHSNFNISWFAEDQDGHRIIGPSGAGVNYWQLSDSSEANDPAGDKGLKWNPGKWKMICSINGIESTIYEFKLGWRTRKILVIGQIVPTTTHDPDKPAGAALSSWAEALADDFAYGLSYGGTGILDQTVFDVFKAGFAQVPTKATESWMGYWSTGLPSLMPSAVPYVAPPLPPASIGPFTASLGTTPRGALGAVTANQRYWMIQHLLNVNDDETSISVDKKYPVEMDFSEYLNAHTEEQYRILHSVQALFFLDDSGQIDSKTLIVYDHNAKNGPTKLNLDLQIGEFGTTPPLTTPTIPPVPIPAMDVPPFSLTAPILQEPSEPSPYNEKLTVASDNLALSSYASARIGLKGQRGSYRLFGKDAPWIFSEIIFEVSDTREIELKVGTSVTTEWTETDQNAPADGGGVIGRAASAPATTPGLCPFNNLNIYDYRPSIIDEPTSDYVYVRRGILEMEGHVECFVESASGAWPEPPTTPSVK